MKNDVNIINPINRFYQHILFEMVSSIEKAKEYVLPYTMISPPAVEEFANKYDVFYLLPQRTNQEYRVITIKRVNQFGKFEIQSGFQNYLVQKEELFFDIKKIIRDKKYFLVRGIAPYIWNGAPLEIRSYVQKGKTGKWAITNISLKRELFAKDSIYDKTTSQLTDALLKFPEKTLGQFKKEIEETTLDISFVLDYYIPNIGSCFVDFIIDDKGSPYLIRVGGFEQEDFLYNLQGGEKWKNYLRNAFEYLIYLSEQKR